MLTSPVLYLKHPQYHSSTHFQLPIPVSTVHTSIPYLLFCFTVQISYNQSSYYLRIRKNTPYPLDHALPHHLCNVLFFNTLSPLPSTPLLRPLHKLPLQLTLRKPLTPHPVPDLLHPSLPQLLHAPTPSASSIPYTPPQLAHAPAPPPSPQKPPRSETHINPPLRTLPPTPLPPQIQ